MPKKVKGEAAVEARAQALQRLVVEYVPTDSIRPNDYNPNRQSDHDFQLLLRSMREDGFTQPVIVHRESMMIVDGEHRWRAAHELELKTIPVAFVDMTPEQMRVATLRHNRARGSEDLDLAADVLRDLQKLGALDWAQDSLMLSDTELNRLMEDVSAAEALAGEEWEPSWEPTKLVGEEEMIDQSVEASESLDPAGGTKLAAMSRAAVEAGAAQQDRLKGESDPKVRAAIRSEARPFRLMCLFEGEEADDVRTALGAEPAENLLIILREWSNRDDA